LVEDNIDLVAGFGGGNTNAVLDDGDDGGVVGDELLVAEELGFA